MVIRPESINPIKCLLLWEDWRLSNWKHQVTQFHSLGSRRDIAKILIWCKRKIAGAYKPLYEYSLRSITSCDIDILLAVTNTDSRWLFISYPFSCVSFGVFYWSLLKYKLTFASYLSLLSLKVLAVTNTDRWLFTSYPFSCASFGVFFVVSRSKSLHLLPVIFVLSYF